MLTLREKSLVSEKKNSPQDERWRKRKRRGRKRKKKRKKRRRRRTKTEQKKLYTSQDLQRLVTVIGYLRQRRCR